MATLSQGEGELGWEGSVTGQSQGGRLSPGLYGLHEGPFSPGSSLKCKECWISSSGQLPESGQEGRQDQVLMESAWGLLTFLSTFAHANSLPWGLSHPPDFTRPHGRGAGQWGGPNRGEAGGPDWGEEGAGSPQLSAGALSSAWGGWRAEPRVVRALGRLAGGWEHLRRPVTGPRAAAAGPRPPRGCPRTRQPSPRGGARHWA